MIIKQHNKRQKYLRLFYILLSLFCLPTLLAKEKSILLLVWVKPETSPAQDLYIRNMIMGPAALSYFGYTISKSGQSTKIQAEADFSGLRWLSQKLNTAKKNEARVHEYSASLDIAEWPKAQKIQASLPLAVLVKGLSPPQDLGKLLLARLAQEKRFLGKNLRIEKLAYKNGLVTATLAVKTGI